MQENREKQVAQLKGKIGTAIDILEWELSDMMGHVSTRTPDGNHFLLRHIRPPVDPELPEDDVLEFDLDGKRISGLREAGGPGFEIYFYINPYKANANVGAVIHCHPPMAVALAAVGQKVIGVLHRHKFEEVPIVPWVYGSLPEHGEIVTKALEKSCAVVIEGHGAVVTGETLEEACVNMLQLERAAKMVLLAAPLGKVKPVSREAVEKFESLVEVRQTKSGRPLAEWRYYERLLQRGERWSRL
jgi:L-fuculose-phosphate aldolase